MKLFAGPHSMAGWEIAIWLAVAACAIALIATLVYPASR